MCRNPQAFPVDAVRYCSPQANFREKPGGPGGEEAAGSGHTRPMRMSPDLSYFVGGSRIAT